MSPLVCSDTSPSAARQRLAGQRVAARWPAALHGAHERVVRLVEHELGRDALLQGEVDVHPAAAEVGGQGRVRGVEPAAPQRLRSPCLSGSRSDVPLICMIPPVAWRIRSVAASRSSGPVAPNPATVVTMRAGCAARSSAGGAGSASGGAMTASAPAEERGAVAGDDGALAPVAQLEEQARAVRRAGLGRAQRIAAPAARPSRPLRPGRRAGGRRTRWGCRCPARRSGRLAARRRALLGQAGEGIGDRGPVAQRQDAGRVPGVLFSPRGLWIPISHTTKPRPSRS